MSTIKLIPLFALSVLVFEGCGSWAGSPKKGTAGKDTPTDGGGSTNVRSAALAPGEMVFHRITLKAGDKVTSKYALKGGSVGLALASDETAAAQEVSVLAPNGQEVKFLRPDNASLEIPVEAAQAGEYIIAVRNNSLQTLSVEAVEAQGASADKVQKANGDQAKFKDFTLKATLMFSKYCTTANSKYMTAARDGNETTSSFQKSVKAKDGYYFVQPIVFFGQVDAAKKVTARAAATIKVKAGGQEVLLKPITLLGSDTLNGSGLTGDEAVAAVRAEYAGFLGAAGEMYTLDTFRKLGNCDTALALPLSADPGKDTVELVIEDSTASPAIAETVPVKVTVNSAITVYSTKQTQQSSWDLCSYNTNNAEAYNYSKGSGACQKFSIANPPSAKIAQWASEIYPGVVSQASDPTRVLFYGRSLSRSFVKALVDNAANNETQASPAVSFSGCLYNGGLVSLPASTEQAYLPVGEFQFKAGDIFSLGTRLGSYTAMPQFYQGDVVADGSLQMARNIPIPDTKMTWKKVTATWTGCKARADSGVFAAAIADYGIYPGDEGMYGVTEE